MNTPVFLEIKRLKFSDVILIKIGKDFYWAYYKDLVNLNKEGLIVTTKKGKCIIKR